MKNYYKVLGLEIGASLDEVKKKYKQLAKQHHPDKNPGDKEAEDRFKEINAAYDGIKAGKTGPDPEPQQHTYTNTNFRNAAMEEMARRMEDELLFRAGFRRQTQSHSNASIHFKAIVPISFLVKGGTYNLKYNYFNTPYGGISRPEQVVKPIHVPPKTPVGTMFTFAGEGNRANPNVAAGDLVVEFLAGNSEGFTITNGVHVNVIGQVSALYCITGTTETVDLPWLPNALKVSIPPGTASGTILRVAGKGLTHANGTVGDFLLHVEATIPKLSESHLAILRDTIERIESDDS